VNGKKLHVSYIIKAGNEGGGAVKGDFLKNTISVEKNIRYIHKKVRRTK